MREREGSIVSVNYLHMRHGRQVIEDARRQGGEAHVPQLPI